jgi:hypothetical protein
MALGHLLLFGVIEGFATALVLRYLQQADPQLLAIAGGSPGARAGTLRKLGSGIAVLAIISPLGLALPALCNSGPAWGEWRPGELAALLGFVPAGMERLAGLWRAPFAGYALTGGNPGMAAAGASYLLSAVIGIMAIALCLRLCGKLSAPKEEK